MPGPYTESAIDMLDFFERQQEWSYETFGPPSHRGPAGPLDHLMKEAREAYAEACTCAFLNAQDKLEAKNTEKLKEEIVDCLFLVFDAAHRAGMSYSEISKIAQEKLKTNKQRKWTPWHLLNPYKASEHDRSEEK